MLPHGPRAAILFPQLDFKAAVLHLARNALEVVAGLAGWMESHELTCPDARQVLRMVVISALSQALCRSSLI